MGLHKDRRQKPACGEGRDLVCKDPESTRSTDEGRGGVGEQKAGHRDKEKMSVLRSLAEWDAGCSH